MPCPTCRAGVALLILAEKAADRGGLEDDARLMYPQVKEVNLPTSVVGSPVGDAPLPDRPADILKILAGARTCAPDAAGRIQPGH